MSAKQRHKRTPSPAVSPLAVMKSLLRFSSMILVALNSGGRFDFFRPVFSDQPFGIFFSPRQALVIDPSAEKCNTLTHKEEGVTPSQTGPRPPLPTGFHE
jgi:hypothetical protein